MTGALPAFFVLGAQKAGTTALDGWLRRQPALALPRPKETHYFSDDERHAKGLAWYLGRFPRGPARVRGEVDPDYLGDPRAPERLARLYGAAHVELRLVAVLREPLARARSQWRMSCRRLREDRPFAEALRASWRDAAAGDRPAGDRDYYARGRYAHHLARFRAALPDARLLAVRFEDLTASDTRAATFARVCAFVGLAGEPETPDFERVANPAGRARSALLQRALVHRGPLTRALGRLVPSQDLRLRLGVWLERANTAPGAPAEPPAGELAEDVRAALAADLDALEGALGWDLADWRAALARGSGP